MADTRKSIDRERKLRRATLRRQKHKIENWIDSNGWSLLRNPDVTGLSASLQIRDGQYVRPLRYVLQVSVRRKGDPTPVKRGRKPTRIPAKVDGIQTDVIEGKYDFCIANGSLEHEFIENPVGGCAIAPASDTAAWGTLGLVVFSTGRPFYLTNEHVSLSSRSIVQPPEPPIAIPRPQWKIGSVARTGSDRNRKVDCALIRATNRQRRPRVGIRTPSGEVVESLIEQALSSADEDRATTFAYGAATPTQPPRLGIVRKTKAGASFPDGSRLIRQIKVESLNGQPLVEAGDSGAALLMELPEDQGRQRFAVVGLVVGKYIEDDGMGVKIGLIANHFRHVRFSLGFKRIGS